MMKRTLGALLACTLIIAGFPINTQAGNIAVPAAVQILTPTHVRTQAATIVAGTTASGATLLVDSFAVGHAQTVARPGAEGTVTFTHVKLAPGPNDVRVVADGGGGPHPAAEKTIYAPGTPVTFTFTSAGVPIADGTTRIVVTVSGFDAWNNPAAPKSPVDVTVAKGVGRLEIIGSKDDLANSAAILPRDVGQQLEGKLDEGGSFVFAFIPGLTSGDVSLTADSPDSATMKPVAYDIFVSPNGRTPIFIGLASVGVGSVPGNVDGNDIFDNGGARRGRLAGYGTGSIGHGTVATFAYESANRLAPVFPFGQYVADPNGRTYLTYGDASTREDDALSLGRFYAKIEHGRNSIMYGEFSPSSSGAQSAGSYQLLLSGVKTHLATKNNPASLNAYTAQDNIGYGRIVVNPLGLATADTFLRPNLIVGSDSITLTVLDRRTGVILSQRLLVRNVDYAIDYETGALRFINVPLPTDPNFNPQVLVATYEYDGLNSGAVTSGANARINLGKSAKLRLGFIEDTGFFSPYSLTTSRISGRSAGGSWSFERDASHGVGSSFNGTLNGEAYRAGFDLGGKQNRFTGSYDSTTAGYGNPYGGFLTPGLASFQLGVTHRLARGGALELSYDGQATSSLYTGQNYRQQRLAANLREVLSDRFTFKLGLSHLTQSAFSSNQVAIPISPYGGGYPPTIPGQVNVNAGANTQANVGFDWKATRNLVLSVDRTILLGGGANATAPAQTTATANYTAGPNHFYVNELWSDSPQFAASQATTPYTALSQATHAQVIGFDRDFGKNTSVTSQYVVDDAMNGSDAYAAFGVRQRFKLNKFLGGDAFIQTGSNLGSGQIVNSSQSHFGLFGIDLAYHQKKRMAASLGIQNRTGLFGGSSITGGLSGRLSSEFSASGSLSATNLGSYSQHDVRFGLAWRPSGNSRGAGLLSYDTYSSNVVGAGSHANVVSYDQVYRPESKLEIAAHIAYKLQGDGFYAAHTTLYGLRVDRRLTRRVDVAAELQTLNFAAIPGAGQNSFAAELGYRLTNHVRVAAGYNFSGAVDPNLVGQPVRRGVFFSITSVLDNILGWGSNPKAQTP